MPIRKNALTIILKSVKKEFKKGVDMRHLKLAFGFVPTAHPTDSLALITQKHTDAEILSWFQSGLIIVGAAYGYVANKDQDGMCVGGILFGGFYGFLAGISPIITVPLAARNVWTSDRLAKEYLRIHYDARSETYSWKK